MNESRDSIAIPLGSEPSLRLQYMNYKNFVRFGKLLEDLDTFAVWISYKHNQRSGPMGIPSHHPMVIVTAAVDEIPALHSKHISIVDHIHQGRRVNFLSARFVTVSQDPITGRATPNMPLITTDPEQEEIVRRGRAAREIHKLDEEHSLLREPPNESERKLLHDIFLKTVDHNSHSFEHRRLPENHVWLEDAKLKNAIICFPIDRNVHGKIFGGYIMRLAFELAWSNAAIYAYVCFICKRTSHSSCSQGMRNFIQIFFPIFCF
ncbi:unnamed protein product [Anisakis simplex]|uniref:Acyl-coenzyme A thioesterase 9, mitochondrial (inferred by orthology to a human protein) n=1 Tax=Anisakis simplex TaxID=6269 RepID=A0A0M3KDV8_ANISI|nr:unnamed protein product [Anisakis simplex]